MRLRTALKIIVVVLIAVIVAAVGVVLAIDPNDYKDEITARVEEQTGRKLTIGGPIGFDLGGTTKLVLQDVAFGNAEWGSQPDMVTVGRVEADVALWPLIGGTVKVERLVLRDADVLIETDAQGRSNLDFPGMTEDDSEGDFDFAIGTARIENVSVTMIDGQADTTTVARLERAIAAPPEAGAPLDVDIKGNITRDRHVATIDLSGQMGSLASIVSGREAVPVNLHGTVLGYEVSVEGGVRQPEHPEGFDVRIAISGDGFSAIQPFLSTELPDPGPVKASGRMSGDPGSPVVEDIVIEAAKTRITGKANLNLSADEIAADYTLKVALDGQDLALVSPYVGMPLEELGPLNGSMNVVGDLEQVRLEPNAITADRSRLNGSIEVNIRKQPLDVKYDLTLTAEGQTLAIVEPFVGTGMPALGPVNGSVRAVGDRRKARVELIDVKADRITLSGQMAAEGLEGDPQFEYDLTLNADGQSLEILRPYVGDEVSKLGTIDGGMRAVGTMDKARIDLEDLAIDRSRITGHVNVDRTGSEPKADYDVTLRADQQALALLRPFLGPDLPDRAPFDLAVTLKGDAQRVEIEQLSLKGEELDLTGSGSVDLTGERPRVEANLNSEIFNIALYIPDETPPQRPTLKSAEEAAKSREPGDSGKIFPADPLPVDLLQAADADVSVKANKLVTPKGEFSDVDLRVLLEDGSLNVRPLNLTYAKSPVSGDLSVETRGGTPHVAASLRAPGVRVGDLLRDFADLDVLHGTGTVNIALNGQGSSVAEIMGSLNGHMRMLMGEGRMRNEGLGYVSGAFSGIREALGGKEWVVVDCMAHDYQLKGGIATSRVSLLNTEVIRLAADGRIDLGEERYHLRITPSPSGLDLSLAAPVDVRGPLDDPGFSPNPVGTLTKLGSLFGSLVFPPAAIVGLAELGGGGNPCIEFAKQNAGQSGATPSSPLEKSPDGGGVLDVPGRALEGLGEGLQDLFGK